MLRKHSNHPSATSHRNSKLKNKPKLEPQFHDRNGNSATLFVRIQSFADHWFRLDDLNEPVRYKTKIPGPAADKMKDGSLPRRNWLLVFRRTKVTFLRVLRAGLWLDGRIPAKPVYNSPGWTASTWHAPWNVAEKNSQVNNHRYQNWWTRALKMCPHLDKFRSFVRQNIGEKFYKIQEVLAIVGHAVLTLETSLEAEGNKNDLRRQKTQFSLYETEKVFGCG